MDILEKLSICEKLLNVFLWHSNFESIIFIYCILIIIIYFKGNFNKVQKIKKKRNTPIYFKINYHTEMKLEPIIMDYCLLQFDALKFCLGVRLHGGGLYLTLIFSMQTPKSDNDILKFTTQIVWIQIFTTIFKLFL